MPAARSPADILLLALYTLAEGHIMRGFMVQTSPSILAGCFAVLATSAALGQSDPPAATPTVRPSGMFSKLMHGELRIGRYGVPADATYEAPATAGQPPYIPGEVYLTDEYGFKYDSRGERIH
jgi:hypothetical protein